MGTLWWKKFDRNIWDRKINLQNNTNESIFLSQIFLSKKLSEHTFTPALKT